MTKTQIGILWGLALLVVVVFAVLSQVIARSPGQTMGPQVPLAPVHRLPGIPQSARSLYPRADQAARSWQADAQLVSATASWSFARVDDFSQPIDWTFQFYSPGTGQLYVVSVDEAQALPITSQLSPYSLPAVSPEAWRVDSQEGLSTWLNQGGAAFLKAHSVVDVSARLHHSADGRLVWSVVGMVRDSQVFHLVRVDAESGQVIE